MQSSDIKDICDMIKEKNTELSINRLFEKALDPIEVSENIDKIILEHL